MKKLKNAVKNRPEAENSTKVEDLRVKIEEKEDFSYHLKQDENIKIQDE